MFLLHQSPLIRGIIAMDKSIATKGIILHTGNAISTA
jgi:hypothetical protein